MLGIYTNVAACFDRSPERDAQGILTFREGGKFLMMFGGFAVLAVCQSSIGRGSVRLLPLPCLRPMTWLWFTLRC